MISNNSFHLLLALKLLFYTKKFHFLIQDIKKRNTFVAS